MVETSVWWGGSSGHLRGSRAFKRVSGGIKSQTYGPCGQINELALYFKCNEKPRENLH